MEDDEKFRLDHIQAVIREPFVATTIIWLITGMVVLIVGC